MHPSFAFIAALSGSVLAAPRPEVEVVQVRQIQKRQVPTSISIDFPTDFPTDLDLSGLASLIPTDLPSDLSNLASLIPTDLPSDIIPSGIGSLVPSGCLPPSGIVAPTPPPDVISALASWTDVCHAPSITGEAGKHYTSYLSAASSWAKENEPKLKSWLSGLSTNCPYASLIPSMDVSSLLVTGSMALSFAGCSGAKQTNAPTGSGAKQTNAPTGSAASGGAASGGSGTPGAAPQQTGFAAAVGVVAGIAGIVAVL